MKKKYKAIGQQIKYSILNKALTTTKLQIHCFLLYHYFNPAIHSYLENILNFLEFSCDSNLEPST